MEFMARSETDAKRLETHPVVSGIPTAVYEMIVSRPGSRATVLAGALWRSYMWLSIGSGFFPFLSSLARTLSRHLLGYKMLAYTLIALLAGFFFVHYSCLMFVLLISNVHIF